MARYRDAVCRLCRRYGEKLYLKGDRCFGPKCAFTRRPTPPGMASQRRRKISDRGLQLREKQRARVFYGLLERQFRGYYDEALRKTGVTGDILVRSLESRLDNVVYRLGLADSRKQARQLVRHGHIALNGRKTDIPSAQVKVGDTISFSARGAKTEYAKIVQETIKSKQPPSWLSLDMAALRGRVIAEPTLEHAEAFFDPNVIVEYYSR
ncbi:MAG TPA: 30S ribosomal protein S4 [Dehalococcoidia bacterium]|nr:30S ribosomal protein S4 [Dehalococcoidia bacterium]